MVAHAHKEVIMRKTLLAIAISYCVIALFFACAPTLKEYQPQSAEEEQIKALLVDWQDSWNNKDQERVLAILHDNAKLMYGRERIVVTKQEYARLLPDRMKKNPTILLRAPKIKLTGDKAEIKVSSTIRGRMVDWAMHAVRQDGRWYLMSWEY
jgi:ketosteroid isomerase-like protein